MRRENGAEVPELRRATEIIVRGIADGLHLGAQLYVSRDGATVADLALGEASGRADYSIRPIASMTVVRPGVIETE
jgi:hypothetical protein